MRGILLCVVLVGALASPGPVALGEPLTDADYWTYDVRVTDTKGVTTEAWDFGFYTGANVLPARRGDAYVDVPFRRIRALEIADYVPGRGCYPARITTRVKGEVLDVEIERAEAQRFLGGSTELGTYRIRLGLVRRLEILRFTAGEGGSE